MLSNTALALQATGPAGKAAPGGNCDRNESKYREHP